MEYQALKGDNMGCLKFYGLAVLLLATYIPWRLVYAFLWLLFTDPRFCFDSIHSALWHLTCNVWEIIYLSTLWDEDKYKARVDRAQRKRDRLLQGNIWNGLVQRADGGEILIDETALSRLQRQTSAGMVESVVPTANATGRGRNRHNKSSSK